MWSQKKAIWQTSSQESHPLFQSTYWKHASSIFSVSAELIFCTTAGEYFLHRNRKSTLSLCTSFSLNLAKARDTDTKACLVCLPVCSWQWKLVYSFQEPSHTMLERSQALGGPTRTMLWSWAAWGTKLLCPFVLPFRTWQEAAPSKLMAVNPFTSRSSASDERGERLQHAPYSEPAPFVFLTALSYNCQQIFPSLSWSYFQVHEGNPLTVTAFSFHTFTLGT